MRDQIHHRSRYLRINSQRRIALMIPPAPRPNSSMMMSESFVADLKSMLQGIYMVGERLNRTRKIVAVSIISAMKVEMPLS